MYTMKHCFMIMICTRSARQSYYSTNQGLHKSFLRRIDVLGSALLGSETPVLYSGSFIPDHDKQTYHQQKIEVQSPAH